MQKNAGAVSQLGTQIGKLVRMIRLTRLLRLSKAIEKHKASKIEIIDDLKEFIKNKPSKKAKIRPLYSNSLREIDLSNSSISNSSNNLDDSGVGLVNFISKKSSVKRLSNNAVLDFQKTLSLPRESKPKKLITECDYHRKLVFGSDIVLPKKSNVAKILNERILKKLIFLVLVMNGTMTLFASDFFGQVDDGWQLDVDAIGYLWEQDGKDEKVSDMIHFIKDKYATYDYELIALTDSHNSQHSFTLPSISLYRESEVQYVTYSSNSTDLTITLIIGLHTISSFSDLLQLLSLIFISILLMVSYYFFTKDTNRQILLPMISVVKFLNILMKYPLDPNYNYPLLMKRNEYKQKFPVTTDGEEIRFELGKIAIWMSYSFGQQHSRFLTQNCLINEKPLFECAATLNAVFAKIELKEEFQFGEQDAVGTTSTLISQITYILQQTIDRYKGAAWHVSDSTFMAVWQIDQFSKDSTNTSHSVEKWYSETVSLAIVALIKFRSKYISYIRKSDLLQSTNIFEEHKSPIRIVIHKGILIQGILGSSYLAQGVYISKDLNMLNHYCRITEDYDEELIITSSVYSHLAECIKSYCRKFDRIKHYDSIVEFYAIDLRRPSQDELRKGITLIQPRYVHFKVKGTIINQINKGLRNSLFLEDQIVRTSLEDKKELKKYFRTALDLYFLGVWESSKEGFKKALEMNPRDGPTLFLLNFMRSFEYQKPRGWRGYRLVTL